MAATALQASTIAVTSISLAGPGPVTTATSAPFQVTFNQSVTGVTTAAFTVSTTGTATGTVASVSGSGNVYTVTVSSLSGTGTLKLNLAGSSAISGSPPAFTSGQSYALAPATAAVAWGYNNYGQLGNNSTNISSVPVAVTTGGALAGKTIVAIAAGQNHSLALANDGTVYAWGFNYNGQLGNNSTTNSSVPVAVTTSGALAGKTIVAIAAGQYHSLALASDGTVYAWGYNGNGQLGNGSTIHSSVPVAVTTSGVLAGKTIVAISAGLLHSVALASDGTVYSWGYNQDGELGNNSTTSSSVPVAVSISGVLGGKTIVAIAGGEEHNLALASDGTVYAWGGNFYGQLGNNSRTSSSVPVAVTTGGVLAGETIVAIAGGGDHSLAVASDGTVYAWGVNTDGQLGNNSTNTSSVPVAVTTSGVLAGKTIVAVAAGDSHSVALASDGTVYTWGLNSSDQLGNNSFTNSSVPVAVTTGGSSAVVSGGTFCAIAPGSASSFCLALTVTTPPPTVTGISPASGPAAGGTVVTITGTGFTFATAVNFGTATTSFRVVSATSITATAPAGTGVVDVTVAAGGSTSALGSADQFTYMAAPTVTGITPVRGLLSGGTVVTITGTALAGATAVNFGTMPAVSFTGNSPTQIIATAPAGSAGVVDVTVTTASGTSATSASDQFTYISPLLPVTVPAPTVTALSVSSGPVGGTTAVTLTGTNFTNVAGVKFGNVNAAAFTVVNPTTITATVPSGMAGVVDVTVTTASGTSATSPSDQFTYVGAPTVTGLTPNSGPLSSGTVVTITGTGFTGATAVNFGSAPAVAYTVNSATQIMATAPAGPAGTVDVTVTTAGGGSGTALGDNYTYVAAARVFVGGFTVTTSSNSAAGRAPAATLAGSIAATVNAASTSATVIGAVGGSAFVVNLAIAGDGSFSGTTTALTAPGSTISGPLTFAGKLVGNVLSGTIAQLGASFAVAADPLAGSSAAISGYYQAASLDASAGTAYSIVGTQGEVLVIAVTPTAINAGTGPVAANDTFSVTTPQGVSVTGSVNPATTTVSLTVAQVSGTTSSYSGLAATTTRTDRLINLSSRGVVTGSNLLVSGLVIGGTASKTVLLRAVGPGLAAFGVPGVLAQPHLKLYDASGKVLSDSTAWGGSSTLAAVFAQVGAFALAPTSADAAVELSLMPGQYTLEVSNAGTDAGGIALAEIYDASPNPAMQYQRLINISTRAFVSAGASNLTGGFIITGNDPKTVLVRGIGPGLTAFGVANALSDPLLTVFDSTGRMIAQNDNWGTPVAVFTGQVVAAAADITAADLATGAFTLTTGSKDAALIVTLPPGAYTAQVTGVGGVTGTALVEIYEVPSS